MSPESTIDRTLWLANVLAAIAQFASEEFQRSAWVSFNGPDGASFEEACNLLGDFGLDDALSSSSSPYQLRPSEQLVLREFSGTLKDYSEHVYERRVRRSGENYASAERIISQPEWQQVRDAALTVLKHFKGNGFPNMPKLPIFDRSSVKVLARYWEV
jgi:hypothetical protein